MKIRTGKKFIISGYIVILCIAFSIRLEAKDAMPNILLLTVDACRPDHLSCYGYPRNTTPHIDKLAKEGVLFTNAFSQSAWTTPGMISIFTSRYPFAHKVNARGDTLHENIQTLPEILKKNGYAVPVFQRFVNIPNYWHLGFDAVKEDIFQTSREEELFKLIEAYKDQKFFLWYHYHGLHLPYNPPEPYDKMFQEEKGMKIAGDSESISFVKSKVIIKHGMVHFRDEDKCQITALYDGQLRQLDDYICRLLEKMESWGILKNTLIIIMADHGDELLDHGFIGHASTSLHATLYDEIIHIPLIIWYPEELAPNKIDSLVQQVDIMPTVLDILGISFPVEIQGNSLLPLIQKKPGKISRQVYCETNKGGYQSTEEMKEIKIRCVRTKRWKLIATSNPGNETFELYDLRNDPHEKNNLIFKIPHVAMNLKKRLLKKIKTAGSTKYASLDAEKEKNR